MQRSESIGNLMAALAKAQGLMQNPRFDSENPHFRSRYASLAAVRDAVIPVLAAQGLAVTQPVTTEENLVICETTLWHESGEYLSTTLRLPVTKPDAQGYGVGMTYAKRYALMALCVVAGDQDDDGQEPVRRPMAATPEQKVRREWADKLNTLMEREGATQEEIERFWRYVAHRHGDVLTVAIGEKLYGELKVRFASRKTPAPAPPPATPDLPSKDSLAWETLRAHQDDANLAPSLLERIQAALSPLAPASESEAHALADEVLNWLDNTEE